MTSTAPRWGLTKPGRTVLAAAVGLAVLIGLASPASASGTGTVSTGSSTATLNVRSQPKVSASIVRTLRNGTKITLECWINGDAVNGRWGRTTLWHKSSGGYVSDGYIYTGVNGPAPGEPKCGTTPPPASNLSARVDAFVKKYNGHKVDYDGAYGYQCVDLFNAYDREVVKTPSRPRVSYAYQLYTTYNTSRYSRLAASTTAKKGDVAIWASNLPGSGGAGHVAIVLKQINSTTLQVFDQNSEGTGRLPAKIHNITKSYLRGYLRPKS